MKKLLLFAFMLTCLSVEAQTVKKPVTRQGTVSKTTTAKRTTTKATTKVSKPVVETPKPEPPSANGKFKCKTSSFVNASDEKDFVVIAVEGKSASDLKSSVINILSGMFDHPDKVISTVGDNIVMVNSYDATGYTEYTNENGRSYSTSYTYAYSLKIEVKDGKIRVNSPSFSQLKPVLHYLGKVKTLSTYGEAEFYDTLHKAKAEYKVENLINSYITKLVQGLSTSDDW